MARRASSQLFRKHLKNWRGRFPRTWRKEAESILAAGEVLAETKPDYQAYSVLTKEMGLAPRMCERLIKIGTDERLRRIQRLLPDSWATLEKIAGLSDEQFHEALRKKLIHPKVKRREIRSFMNGESEPAKKEDWSGSAAVITVRVDRSVTDPDYVEEVVQSIKGEVKNLQDYRDMDCVECQDHGYLVRLQKRLEKEQEREMAEALAARLKEGQRIVRNHRRHRLKSDDILEREKIKVSLRMDDAWNHLNEPKCVDWCLEEIGSDFRVDPDAKAANRVDDFNKRKISKY